MQQEVSVVEVVQQTFPFIDRSRRTENSEDVSDPVLRQSGGHSSCVTETGTHGRSSWNRLLVKLSAKCLAVQENVDDPFFRW